MKLNPLKTRDRLRILKKKSDAISKAESRITKEKNELLQELIDDLGPCRVFLLLHEKFPKYVNRISVLNKGGFPTPISLLELLVQALEDEARTGNS